MDKLEKRLNPTAKIVKKLLLRSGNECAFPNCSEVIFNDRDELIGECCHIEAALPGGERFNVDQTPENRRSFDNLMFLCHRHHVETNDINIYSIDVLKGIKKAHEDRFGEKSFSIKSNYVTQIINSFEEINVGLKNVIEGIRRVGDTQNTILDILEKDNSSTQVNAQTTSIFFGPPVISGFKGRTLELAELASFFQDYNSFSITGLTGIGKSSFISHFLGSLTQYKILWIDCETIRTQEQFFTIFAKFISQEFDDNSLAPIVATSDQSMIHKSVVYSLKAHDICIVADGLNSPNHELFSFCKLCNEHLSNSKLIISTNRSLETVFWANKIYKKTLIGLDEHSYSQLFSDYGVKSLATEESRKLYYLLGGHPFLLKLCVSILEYQPVSSFILQLEGQGFEEITEYVKHKFFEYLSGEEIELLRKLSILAIPFRYTVGDYINASNYPKIFRKLRQNFLIEIHKGEFFKISEFIKAHVIKYVDGGDKKEVHRLCVDYLLSVKPDRTIFEGISLIEHALLSELNEIAETQVTNFLPALMKEGEFNLAYKIASDLQVDAVAKKWSIIYYIQGRVLRFQNRNTDAIKKYDVGLSLSVTLKEKNTFKFERAAILTYLSRELKDKSLLAQAISIYEDFALMNDSNLFVQSQMSLVRILLNSKKYSEATKKMEHLISTVNTDDIQSNVLAGMWQLLGDAYCSGKKYQKAFDAFDKSIDLYKGAIQKYGMNVIDGLYHLYESYGWTYAYAGHYSNAAELFSMCVGLSKEFNLGLNKGRALFDYGYHLTLARKYDEAVILLTEHYSFIIENGLIADSDMVLVYGTLAFAHWYSGKMIDAVELLALYILSCHENNIQPIISLVEEDSMMELLDVIHYFKGREFIFIIPSGKKIADFMDYMTEVCLRRPELEEPLNHFNIFKKE